MSTNLTRITGMYSGFDTDQLVKDLIKAESLKVDKVKQDKIYAEWQQEAYRDIINDIRAFKDDYFSTTKPEANFRSTSSFIGYETNMKNEADSWYVDVEVGSASVTGNYTITDITLAEKATIEGSNPSLISKDKLNEKLSTLFPNLNNDDGTNGDVLSFKINNNGTEYTFDIDEENETLNDVISKVNSSEADVKMYYDEIKNKIIIESEDIGSSANISISDSTGSLMSELSLHNASDTGADSQVTIKDESGTTKTVSSSTNSVTVNGITLDLKQNLTSGSIDFSVETSSDKIINNIKGFVEKYNNMIKNIDDKLKEKKNYDYYPLTDEQKEGLSDEEVKKWEEKAKSGILKGDNNLSSLLTNLRNALYNEVDGMHIFDIGITTSSDRTKPGQLIVDEDKLKKAIEEDPQKVANLFAKEDTGLANKMYDVIEQNITTRTDTYGNKGFLLEKAGMEGDRTDKDNYLSDKIDDYDDMIREMLDDLTAKENYYYSMFAKMEQSLAQMQSQSSWLSGQ